MSKANQQHYFCERLEGAGVQPGAEPKIDDSQRILRHHVFGNGAENPGRNY